MTGNISTTRQERLRAWQQSLRLHTLPLAFVAIFVGSALAQWQDAFVASIALLTALTATLLQILSNLANDYGDVLKGADTFGRIGPRRGMHTGLISPAQMRRALWICSGLCVLSGSALIALACRDWATAAGFLMLGLLAIIAALTYTLGRHAYGYLGLGDLSVLMFFGWVGVIGSYWLQTGLWNPAVLLPATASGLFAAAVLNINNMRDIETDPRAGKKTLAVRLGPRRARRYHAALLASAWACLAAFAALHSPAWSVWLFVLMTPALIRHARQVMREPRAEAMRPMLARTVKAVMLTQLLFALGVVLA